MKSEQLELDSIHPFPFVIQPSLYEEHAESVVKSIGAFEQLLTEHGVIVSKTQNGLYALQSASEFTVEGAPLQSPVEHFDPLL